MLILASKSPRRRVLLTFLTEDFTVDPVQVTEAAPRALPVPDAVEVIARKKAIAASKQHRGKLALGADTVVAYRGSLVGKARSDIELRSNLAMLSDETHQVVTGIALARNGSAVDGGSVTTNVRFDRLPPDVVGRYADSDAWLGKAGGYGIQDRLLAPYIHIHGPWSNVVGLPLGETAAMLARNDVVVEPPPEEAWLRDHNPFETASE